MPSEPLIISFADTTAAAGNRLTGTLAEVLRDTDQNVVVDRKRDRPDSIMIWHLSLKRNLAAGLRKLNSSM
jgi:hypothetical protein